MNPDQIRQAAIKEDPLATRIHDFIEKLPAAQRLYPDVYAVDLAVSVRALMKESADVLSEITTQLHTALAVIKTVKDSAQEGLADCDDDCDMSSLWVLETLLQAPTEALTEHDRELTVDVASKAAEISEVAFLLHEMGTPGEGPFTNGQRYADEARVQIAQKIRDNFQIPAKRDSTPTTNEKEE